MLSILPKHVADEMLKDMKKDESQKDQQQFNTMYMYRHENVRCARRGPGLPGQDGAGRALVGSACRCRLEGFPVGAALLTDTVAETCFGLRGPAYLLHRCHPDVGRDICEAA